MSILSTVFADADINEVVHHYRDRVKELEEELRVDAIDKANYQREAGSVGINYLTYLESRVQAHRETSRDWVPFSILLASKIYLILTTVVTLYVLGYLWTIQLISTVALIIVATIAVVILGTYTIGMSYRSFVKLHEQMEKIRK